MKKIALLLISVSLVSSLCSCKALSGISIFKQPQNTENVVEMKVVEEVVEEPVLEKVVTISAVGDCTLATDVNAKGSGSFEAEVEKVNSDYSYFLSDAKKYFENDDLTIVNFEGTLSEQGKRQSKQFAFRGKPEYVNILTSSSVEAANLANNHSRDYGDVSYDDTIATLEKEGIACFNGTKTALVEKNGVNIGLVGIYALTDSGKKQLEPAMEAIKSQNPDIIIVSFHWGAEKAKAPNSTQKKLAYQAVDLGADLVIGHHPHVLQGIEKYNGTYILYSLGNFCFGGNKNMSDKDTAMFRQSFTIDADGNLLDDDAVEIIPFSASSSTNRNDYHPTPATGEQRERIIKKLTDYSTALGSDAVLYFGE